MSQVDEVRGGTERSATTLELFFDLVYVYAITQVVALIHGEPTAAGLAKGALLLLIMWWTWSIYTWTTNWTGTRSVPIRLFLLATMGASLAMAAAVPDAFGDSSRLFGITLFSVRILAAGLYWVASKEYEAQRAAFFTFFPISLLAASFYLTGGFLEGGWLLTFFLGGAALDVFSAINAGRGTWAVDASHFAERNGLFVIIALGESVVGIGLTATHVPLDLAHMTALLVSFVGVAALWWAYFDRAAPYAEAYFTRLTGYERGRFARDAYSFIHYPLVVGIVFFAVALEDVVAHPADPLPLLGRFAMGAGVALVLLSVVAGTYRAIERITWERLIASAVLIGLIWVASSLTALAFAIVVVAVLVMALVLERTHPWPQPRLATTRGGP